MSSSEVLNLLVAYAGTPRTEPVALVLDGASLVVYAAAHTVVLLDAPTLKLVNTLVFSDVFPSAFASVSSVVVDDSTKLIAAAADTRVAIWTSHATDGSSWKTHSTLSVDKPITSIELHANFLCVGTSSGLSVYSLDTTGDLATWKLAWSAKCPKPASIRVSPTASHVAVASSDEKCVRIYSMRSHKQSQRIPHPYPVSRLKWRNPPPRYKDEICLYTMTPDSVVRVFMPVIDAPTHLQLHAALDRQAFDSFPAHGKAVAKSELSSRRTDASDNAPVFWLDRSVVLAALPHLLEEEAPNGTQEEAQDHERGRRRKLKEFLDEDWELFAFVSKDDSLIVRALTNLDKRPPTLLKHFTYFKLPPQSLHQSPHLLLIPSPPSNNPASLDSPPSRPRPPAHRSLSLITTSPLRTHQVSLLPLIDGAAEGVRRITRAPRRFARETARVEYFARSPDGSTIASKRVDSPEGDEDDDAGKRTGGGGGGEIFTRDRRGTLHNRQSWTDKNARAIALLDSGRGLVVFDSEAKMIIVHLYLQGGSHEEMNTLRLAHGPPSDPALFILPSTEASAPSSSSSAESIQILSITPTSISTFILSALSTNKPRLVLHSTSSLPLDKAPRLIMPVDPMAWSHEPPHHRDSVSDDHHPTSSQKSSRATTAPRTQVHDALVSVSEDGQVAFWIPAIEPRARVGPGVTKSAAKSSESDAANGWIRTGGIQTGRTGIRLARCSSAKKTAIVSVENGVETLSIWDSKESEFASGLEYTHCFLPPGQNDDENFRIRDLDWTSTGSGLPSSSGGAQQDSSILAVGFRHRVVLLCQQRMTYFDQEPAWTILGEIDLTKWTPLPIADSIWCAGGTLIVGAGHQVFCFGTPSSAIGYQRLDLVEKEKDGSESDSKLIVGIPKGPTLFERVARVNGPLPDYHPQMLLQCLLWDKVELVKKIIVQLGHAVRAAGERDFDRFFEWNPLAVDDYLVSSQSASQTSVTKKQNYSYLFDSVPEEEVDDEAFTASLVRTLLDTMEKKPLPRLTASESAHLAVLIRTTLQIDEQRRSLDANGLRYLISIRSFYLINQAQSDPTTNASLTSAISGAVRHRIRYRDIVWASFSQSQEILLAASTEACGGKMSWKDARALGVFLWLRSIESVKIQAEVVARNQYMSGDDRDPTACCLLYFALGKVRLVLGLWKQAVWHPEQQVMLKFLANNFDEDRWRRAALKNAFALMSKQRYEYAAAFFVLGRSLRDAVNVCLKNLKDFQLAVALARIMENGDDGPVLKDIIVGTVLPTAFEDGNRWLASWAFWTLHRRDLSVRVLLTPLEEIARIADVRVKEIGNPHYDDPSLALLFIQLKDKSLQTVKGLSEISGRTEFNFVLQMARVFARMGCHALALNLVTTWSFDRIIPASRTPPPPTPSDAVSSVVDELSSALKPEPRPRSPTNSRSSLAFHLARAPSLVIDMEIPSLPVTRAASPTPQSVEGSAKPAEIDTGSEPRRTGLGSLMKSAKKDVKVAEFNMDAFF